MDTMHAVCIRHTIIGMLTCIWGIGYGVWVYLGLGERYIVQGCISLCFEVCYEDFVLCRGLCSDNYFMEMVMVCTRETMQCI